MFLTPLEINQHITANYNSFKIESYVEVRTDYAPGFDIPYGCGYVERIVNNVIAVKYASAQDGDRLHEKIQTSWAVTAILHQDMTIPTEDR